jgi:hypothetical protein
LNILQGVAEAAAELIVAALLINAISSINIALYVPEREALGLADSPVIEPVPSLLERDIYLLYSEPEDFVYQGASIQSGRLLNINLVFSNNDLISPILSTSVSFCEITWYLWLWKLNQ